MRTSYAVTIAAIAVLAVLFASFIVSTGSEEGGDGSFVILHSNDSHCHLGNDDGLGFSTLKSLKEIEQSKNDAVFVFDAGDFLQGNVNGTLTQGEACVRVMNEVGYDLGVPGNHEFDYGYDIFMERIKELDYPIICANLVDKDTGESVLDEYKILKKGGVTLGCFGLLTPETAEKTKKGNMGNTVVTDPVEAAKSMVSLLKSKNVDYIVCIGHIGVERSQDITSDQICSQVPGIDIFVDGHSHTEMEDGKVCDGSVDLIPSDTLIVSTGCYCNAFGIVTVDKDSRMTAKLYRGEKMADPTIDKIVAEIQAYVDKELGVTVCTTTIALDGVKDHVRRSETNLGDLVADALRDYCGTQIAITVGGGIRASIEPGEITLEDVYNVMPYENELVTMTVTGDTIYQAMEHSFSHVGENFGGFLQISGMTVTYDPSADVGSRIVSITVDGKEMDRSAEYTIAMSDFLSTGGDGHEEFVNYPTQNHGFDTAAFGDYLKKLGSIDESTIQGGRLVSA